MLYLLNVLLLILSVYANTSKMCINKPSGYEEMVVSSRLVGGIMNQYRGSCIGTCPCPGNGNGGPVQDPNNPQAYTAQIAAKNAFHVPTDVETVYACTVFDASLFEEDMWVTDVNIQTTSNQQVIHHGVLYAVLEDTPYYDEGPYEGCERDEDGHITDYASCIRGAGSHFKHGDVIPDCFETRELSPRAEVVFAFQRGNPDFHAPAGTGIKVGPSTGQRWLLFQAHYHNEGSSGEIVDASRLTLKLTKEEKTNLGVLLFGNFPHPQIYLPPMRDSVQLRQEIAPSGSPYPIQPPEPDWAVYPQGQGPDGLVRVGLIEHLLSKQNVAEIMANQGIDIHISAPHFHGMGRALSNIVHYNSTTHEWDPIPLSRYWQSGHGHDASAMRSTGWMGLPDGSEAGNVQTFSPPLHLTAFATGAEAPLPPYYSDGLDLLIDYNTSMKHHPTVGGYSTNEEMAYNYLAYSPAPSYQPTIYAFAPCRMCNDFQGTFWDYEVPNGGGGNSRDAGKRHGDMVPQVDINGNVYMCVPGPYQTALQHSPLCD